MVTESPLSFLARKNALTASEEKGGGVTPAHAVTEEILASTGGDKPGQVSVSAPPTSWMQQKIVSNCEPNLIVPA